MLRQLGAALSSELDGSGYDGNERQQHQSESINPMFSAQQDDIDLTEINPLDLFCSSIDSLCGKSIDLTIPHNSGWAERPSWRQNSHLPNNGDNREESRELCRRGIPPSLRCAAWIINVVSAANLTMSKSDCDDYGTLKKVRVLEHGWDLVLKSIFPDPSDLERAEVLDFGVGHDQLINILMKDHGGNIPERGIQSLTKVLHAARDSLGIEYCLWLPDITCLLLSFMPESYAYSTIREMINEDSSYFLAVSRVEHLAWCKTFADLMRRCFPQTAAIMGQIGALTPLGLDPIMKRFFVTLLKREHVMRVMDIFTGEGAHAIFRIGTTLCCLSHAHLGESIRERCDNAATFWEGVRRFAHSKHFDFEIFLSQVYMTKKILGFRRPVFPRPEVVSRIISENEVWAENNLTNISVHEEKKPLGLVEGDVPMTLAKDSFERLCLARWLPPVLQSTKLDLIYSTSHHGRSLEMFYRCCSSSRHTITLMEVLGTDIVIGMYATHTWKSNPDGYGDGGCFLFRLTPNAECFRFKPTFSSFGAEEGDDEKKVTRLQDVGQLMISSESFISMGVGEGGASGLRLNEDLTRGSTSKSMGFDNDELVGPGIEVFDVGLVEVYRFIRDVDNKPVDGDVDPWKGVFE
uniref:Oxidation resistance protein 1 n=1 Tax=Skeletonema marinoi TaxID=267567 RepID=A0A7S2M7W1_9STRA|mmetsp:Transcript_552/g.859  ORF Transcript_552/g.859 Transcript_552/m.859 type:complete len:633 (+) Transcript_552:79-1977(+)